MAVSRRFAAVLLCVFLQSCGQASLEHDLREYQKRLARVLKTEPPTAIDLSTTPLPAARDLRIKVEQRQINLLTLAKLNQCELGQVIANRNTSLGRTQTAAGQVVFEAQLLNSIDACINALKNDELRKQLTELKQQKQKDYAKHWANILHSDRAFRQAVSPIYKAQSAAPIDSLSATKSALQALIRWQAPTALDSDTTVSQLQVLEQNRLPAKVFYTQQLLAKELKRTTAWLKQQDAKVLCQTDFTRAGYLQNVFQLFFIEKIQPTAARVNQAQYALFPVLQQLADQPLVAPQLRAFLQWHLSEQQQAYAASVREHVAYWQDFYRACGFVPGG